MPLSEKQKQHPRFMRFSDIANEALASALKSAELDPAKLQEIDVHAGRVVDDITALLMRAEKVSQFQKTPV
jgi:hypothetical protein